MPAIAAAEIVDRVARDSAARPADKSEATKALLKRLKYPITVVAVSNKQLVGGDGQVIVGPARA